MALLGEMHHSQTRNDSWVNLPRERGVAYAAQEPWIISGTVKVAVQSVQSVGVRAQLLRGKHYIQRQIRQGALRARYVSMRRFTTVLTRACHPVLHQCSLEQDLVLWQAGDRTEVGEKGIALR
jgi:hypothetical protein